MSSGVNPAVFNAFSVAGVGPVPLLDEVGAATRHQQVGGAESQMAEPLRVRIRPDRLQHWSGPLGDPALEPEPLQDVLGREQIVGL